jgi:hypothetical protein
MDAKPTSSFSKGVLGLAGGLTGFEESISERRQELQTGTHVYSGEFFSVM